MSCYYELIDQVLSSNRQISSTLLFEIVEFLYIRSSDAFYSEFSKTSSDDCLLYYLAGRRNSLFTILDLITHLDSFSNNDSI